jgi:hypothetical protein
VPTGGGQSDHTEPNHEGRLEVLRPWQSISTAYPCPFGLCTPPEWCQTCILNFPAPTDSKGDVPGYADQLPSHSDLGSRVELILNDYEGVGEYTEVSKQGYDKVDVASESVLDSIITPIQRFVVEPAAIQPYNAIHSFIPLGVGGATNSSSQAMGFSVPSACASGTIFTYGHQGVRHEEP